MVAPLVQNVAGDYCGLLGGLKPFVWVHTSELLEFSEANADLRDLVRENISTLSSSEGFLPTRHLSFRLLSTLRLLKEKFNSELRKRETQIGGSPLLKRLEGTHQGNGSRGDATGTPARD